MSRNSFSYRLENLKKAFVDQITPCIMDGMMSIYEECVAINNSKTNVNATFKEILDQIPGWKSDILDGENNRILMCIKSADKLFKNILKHDYILWDIESSDYPQFDKFIHDCYRECSKEFYNHSNLWINYNYENQRSIHNGVNDCIYRTLRKYIPLEKQIENRTITNSFFSDEDEMTSESASESESSDETQRGGKSESYKKRDETEEYNHKKIAKVLASNFHVSDKNIQGVNSE